MDTNLIALREAKAIACVDLHGSLDDLRWHLKALDDRNGLETLGRITGNAHELELLHKRELSLIETGREPQEEGAEA